MVLICETPDSHATPGCESSRQLLVQRHVTEDCQTHMADSLALKSQDPIPFYLLIALW
jgi:hypothetical protein